MLLRTFAALALLLPAGASAHAILMESQPAAGAATPAGPVQVVLRFNSRIDAGRSSVTVRRGADQIGLKIQPGGSADQITAGGATLAPGDYTLRWQVLALDGHMTRGDVPFTVRAP